MSLEVKPKVMMVGIDAADPDYINRRIEAGGLPNIKSFRESGAWGKMRSTFPVLSSAAWSTIATGLPPEKHGIYEFFRRKPDTWNDLPIHGGMKKGDNFWDIAARNNIKSVVVNMPISYPPRAPEGSVLVSGMDTPGETAAFTYPPEEKAELLKNIPDYRIELTAAMFSTVDAFLDAVENTMAARLKAAKYLFKKYQPEMAVVIFTSLDRVLHALWKYVDPIHKAYNYPEVEKYRGRVDKLYDQVDSYLGELLEWAGENCTTVVCSDHGGAAVHGVFYLNRWLAREGYLSVHSATAKSSGLKVWSSVQKFIKAHFPQWIKDIGNKLFPSLYVSVDLYSGLSRINAEKTKVYAWRKTDVMRVNLEGREPDGQVKAGEEYNRLVNEVKEKLEKVVDPRNGRKPVKKVWTRDEAYPLASELEDCPDLVIQWDDLLYEVDTSIDNLDGDLFVSEEKPDKPWRDEINGNHALYGVYGVKGPNVEQGIVLEEVDILSVAPTMLMGLEISKTSEMPGQVPQGVFKGDVKTEKAAEAESSDEKNGSDDVYTDEEREMIEKRLRDLGYM